MRYLAFVISQASREALLKAFPPKFPVSVCHHVTVVTQDEDPLFLKKAWRTPYNDPSFPAEKKRVVVVGYASGPDIECLVCRVGSSMLREDGELFHITHSKVAGVPNHMSNYYTLYHEPLALPFLIQGEFHLEESTN